jgi:predicted DsbA family dithiol-disulfide isomerase
VERLSIDVWSDVVCPWCYIGKRHLERALAGFEHAAAVEVTWHAFELDPRAPATPATTQSTAERLATKYHVTVEQAEAMIARVVDAGQRAGLELRAGSSVPANTFDAPRLSLWAIEHGRQGALVERLFAAHFVDNLAIGDRDQLAQLAGEVGLPAAEAREILDGDRYAAETRFDESQARELGITGVPFYVLDGRIGVSGAQPVETLSAMLAKAWSELRVA